MNAEYLMHAPCMRDVQSGYERCAVEYQSHVREHSGNNNNGAGATLGGSSIADDPVENSKKLCWYIHFFFSFINKNNKQKISSNLRRNNVLDACHGTVRSRITWSVRSQSLPENAELKLVFITHEMLINIFITLEMIHFLQLHSREDSSTQWPVLWFRYWILLFENKICIWIIEKNTN